MDSMVVILLIILFSCQLFLNQAKKPDYADELSRDYVTHVLPIDDPLKVQKLVDDQRSYAESIQMHYRTKAHKKGSLAEPLAPFTLLPSKFPRKIFDQAWALQPAMNLLYFRASLDIEFLRETLAEVAKVRPNVQKMIDMIDLVHKEGGYARQPISVNVQRADYMCHVARDSDDDESYELKQIEVNNGAPGGSAMAHRATRVHRRALRQLGLDASVGALRDNAPDAVMAEALHLAWLQFGDPNAIMLNIMGNVYDENVKRENWVFELDREIEKISSGKLKTVNIGLLQCADRLRLDTCDFSLYLDDGRKVAIANFRGGSSVKYEKGRHAMLTIERSKAIKAPTIGFDLLGLKKVQQALTQPGMVERFFPNPEEAHYVKAIRRVFAGMWALEKEDAETKRAVEDAMAHPENYVLKPMLEGGGHNFFGKQVAEKLHSFTRAERGEHILMQRLQPMVIHNFRVAPTQFKPKFGPMVGELSIYGCLVGNSRDKSVLYNRAGGYQVRTKGADSDEGGILVGAGAYDSPYLY